MATTASIQEVLNPLFPGLMGIQLMEVTPERVVASMEVRPDLCTTGKGLHGGAIMAFADTLGARGHYSESAEGHAHHNDRIEDQLPACSAGTLAYYRGVHRVSSRQDLHGVVDANQDRHRQTVRSRYPDTTGSSVVTCQTIRQVTYRTNPVAMPSDGGFRCVARLQCHAKKEPHYYGSSSTDHVAPRN